MSGTFSCRSKGCENGKQKKTKNKKLKKVRKD
jgi:hypothetical protein